MGKYVQVMMFDEHFQLNIAKSVHLTTSLNIEKCKQTSFFTRKCRFVYIFQCFNWSSNARFFCLPICVRKNNFDSQCIRYVVEAACAFNIIK